MRSCCCSVRCSPLFHHFPLFPFARRALPVSQRSQPNIAVFSVAAVAADLVTIAFCFVSCSFHFVFAALHVQFHFDFIPRTPFSPAEPVQPEQRRRPLFANMDARTRREDEGFLPELSRRIRMRFAAAGPLRVRLRPHARAPTPSGHAMRNRRLSLRGSRLSPAA